MSSSARTIAYADLVGGLIDARTDPATERFDAELAAAVAAGSVTPETARRLRFWQRAAIRGVVDHARNVLPPAMQALDAARSESEQSVAAEERSWVAATHGTADGGGSDENGADERGEGGSDADASPEPETPAPTDEERVDSTQVAGATITVEESGPRGPFDTARSINTEPSIDLSDRRSRLIVAGLTEISATPTRRPDSAS
ncbi:MAG: hypothetical protein QOJ49_1575 [Actinomycetota bacterium]|jgi:hypothetical protein|nr:hypothetical protein [Actinomycetota bacterium]MDQ1642099.1 hypothetical protein [Actinomycetota bacterium]